MNTKLAMRYPSSWHQEMWREGAPFGNGLVGGMVYGVSIKKIQIFNPFMTDYQIAQEFWKGEE